MTTNQHTPGPWTAEHGQIYADEFIQLEGGAGYPRHTNVATANDMWTDKTTRHANARLIAAAPELLAALQWAIEQLPRPVARTNHNGQYVDGYEAARAAIAKATGN